MTLLYTTILSLSLSFVAWMNLPQNYNEGLAAHQAGDYDTALKEWRPLAEQGHAITQYNLALMYNNGEGIAEDNVEAAKWYQRAAEQGYASAQNNLGNMYKYGYGVLQDNMRAHMWYNIASGNGHKSAGDWRDGRAGFMNSSDIKKATDMAKKCIDSDYKNCVN